MAGCGSASRGPATRSWPAASGRRHPGQTGIGRDYHEDWTAGPKATDVTELSLRDGTGRAGMLLRIGNRFGYVRGRTAGIAPTPGTALRDAVAHADLRAARALMDLKISLGSVEGGRWLITRSTLPFRIGDDLAPDLGDGEITAAERTSAGDDTRRRWTVVPVRSDHLLAL